MCFEVAVLSPLAAAWDATDAAMVDSEDQREVTSEACAR